MTREEILAMKAGRELDALVAQEIMGERIEWRDCPTGEIIGWEGEPFKSESIVRTERRQVAIDGSGEIMPFMWAPGHLSYSGHLVPYSTNISAAWQVIGKLRSEFYCIEIKITDSCCVTMELLSTPPIKVVVNGGTLSEAICRAALLAKEQDARKI